jgi:hypothetical protein
MDTLHSVHADHGTNHTCKLVIEAEALMLCPWWFEQDFVEMVATCNYLEDGISIAYDVVIDYSRVMTVLCNIMCIACFVGEIRII